MLSYYLKRRKNTESKNRRAEKMKKERICLYQTMQFPIVKNQD